MLHGARGEEGGRSRRLGGPVASGPGQQEPLRTPGQSQPADRPCVEARVLGPMAGQEVHLFGVIGFGAQFKDMMTGLGLV